MNSHALIIGGGIGGLLAAHALSGQFDRVSVLERDQYPDLQNTGSPAMRPGVPQSRCLHLLMAAGIAAIDDLLPDWTEQLASLGALAFDASADAHMRLSTGCLSRAGSGITLYACSRSLLEHVLRQRMSPDTGIAIHSGREVVQLAYDHRANSVTGVCIREAGSETSQLIEADLVVDASGSASRLPLWLAQLSAEAEPHLAGAAGRPSPLVKGEFPVSETLVSPGRRQVSCWYQIKPEDEPDWQCLAIAPDAANDYRSVMVLRAEHHRWGVVLVDPTRDPLPRDHRTFQALLARFDQGRLAALLARGRPVSPVHRLRPSLNRWRHYEQMDNWPSGLCALGDSACALDPYSGLGMSVAARASSLLKAEAGKGLTGRSDSRRFQQALARQNRQPWELATGCDLHGHELPADCTGLQQLYAAAPGSQSITQAILAVQNLLTPRETLMSMTVS